MKEFTYKHKPTYFWSWKNIKKKLQWPRIIIRHSNCNNTYFHTQWDCVASSSFIHNISNPPHTRIPNSWFERGCQRMSRNVSGVMHNQQLTSIVDIVLKKYDKSQLNYYIKHTCLVEEKKKKRQRVVRILFLTLRLCKHFFIPKYLLLEIWHR